MSDDAGRSEAVPVKPHPRLRRSDSREIVADFRRRLTEREKNDGEVLFQGSWLKPDEAGQRFKRLVWPSRLRIVELIVVMLLLLVLTVFPFMFLGVLGGIAG